MMRVVYLFFGLSFVVLGFIGIFLPVLPTTPFLLLAAACFARSSKKLEAWLLLHPIFGSLLQDWQERGAIPVKAKFMAMAGCILGFSLFLWSGQTQGVMILPVALIMVLGMVYIFTRPSA